MWGKTFFASTPAALHRRFISVQILERSTFRHEDRSRGDTRLPAVSAQRPAELFRQKDDPLFSLAVHLRPARFQGLHRDEAQFGDADAGGADRLKNEVKCTPCQGQIKKKGFLFFNQQISILLSLFGEVVYWPVLLKAIRLLGDSTQQGRLFGFLEAGRGVVDKDIIKGGVYIGNPAKIINL